MIQQNSPFYKIFKSGLEKMQAMPVADQSDYQSLLSSETKPADAHKRTYNTPSVAELAAIVPVRKSWTLSANNEKRQLVLQLREGGLQVISTMHRWHDALHYVLFFIFGDDGWTAAYRRQFDATLKDFMAYRLMFHD